MKALVGAFSVIVKSSGTFAQPSLQALYYWHHQGESPKQLVLFPEGTNLSPRSRARSDEFARKSNRAPATHLLHPRTTGFVHLVKGELTVELEMNLRELWSLTFTEKAPTRAY